ncbi:MAG TPA: two-component regulator propeller domain-containing protein [Flavobacteriales bacterium]|nr:two-component regulator propeller domain-containing protein [Flavobacteriales bacterium]
MLKPIFILCVFFCFLHNLQAQRCIKVKGEHNFHNYTVQDGLVSSAIEIIIQDKKGNLWIGTHGGLSRYNGKTFENFTTGEGLPDNSVSWIAEGPDGKIWFSTHQGICSWDGRNLKSFSKKDGLLHNQCWRILFNKKGELLIATSKGINIMRTNGKIETFLTLEIKNNDAGTAVIRGMFIDSQENFWFSTNSEVYLRKKNSTENILVGGIGMVFDYLEEKDGTVWFCSWGGAIYSWKNGELKGYTTGTPINSIEKDKNGNIWLATWDKGIWKFDKKNFYMYDSDNGLSINSVWGLHIDNEGNIWGGTFGAGLSCLKNQTFVCYSQKSGLVNNALTSMCLAPDTSIWLAAEGGISRFMPTTGTFTNFTEKEGVYNTKVMGITAESNGTIWATLYAGPKFIKIKNGKIDQQAPAGAGFGMYSDSHDTIWWGTDGRGAFNMKDGKVRNVVFGTEHSANRIFGIVEDTKHNKWFTPWSGGLHVYTKGKTLLLNKSAGFTNKNVNGPVFDNKGTLWANWGEYLYACRFENDKIRIVDSLSVKKYFGNKTLGAIYFDNETKNLWITTVTNLYCLKTRNYYNDRTIQLKTYTKGDGYPGNECAGILKTPDGKLWFASKSGLVSYDPEIDKENNVGPYLNLTGIKLFLENPDWSALGITEFDGDIPKSLELRYNQNYLTFHFNGISNSAPEDIVYTYLLQGFENKWSPEGTEQEVTYSNLAPGTYVFKAKAKNGDGVWSKELRYSFTILPAFWQTLWFKLCVGVLVILGIYIFIKARTRQLNRANKILETKVEARTEQLRHANDELEEKNKDILDSLQYARQIQKTILPPENVFYDNFNEHFILYKPRDIVSGDFYWFEKQNGTIFFAVADCTGHGVPGAMVSLVCSNALNKVVKELKITEPGKILDKVSEIVESSFVSEDGHLRDGMDISLVSINLAEKKLYFAGANNPALVKGNIKSNDLHKLVSLADGFTELKPDKQPIGMFAGRKAFTTLELTWQDGLQVYLFSDGFADQFGGPKGKKFKYTSLHALINEMSNQEMQKQFQTISGAFESWKNWNAEGLAKEFEQLDDVCVVGLKC